MLETLLIGGTTYILTVMAENPKKREKILSFLDTNGRELRGFVQSISKKGGDTVGEPSDIPNETESE